MTGWGALFYFTSNQDCTDRELGLECRYDERGHKRITPGAYDLIHAWGLRLKVALGPDVLERNAQLGGEFRPPTYRSSIEALERAPWTAYDRSGRLAHVVPYNTMYDGWRQGGGRHGFMASAVNPYEFAYDLWEQYEDYHPDLLDNATWAAWSELLPEPVGVAFPELRARMGHARCEVSWGHGEPRVHRSQEMGRYQIPVGQTRVSADGPSWRVARAEALVRAFEKMAAMEPDGYMHKLDAASVRAHLPPCKGQPCECGAEAYNTSRVTITLSR